MALHNLAPIVGTTGPSAAIWADCPWLQILEDPNNGRIFFDDFLSPPVGTAAGTVLQQGYAIYVDAGGAAQGIATEVCGEFRITTDNTQHDEGSITTGGNVSGMGVIASTGGKDLWFEARVRVNTTTEQAFFVGLAEQGCAVVDTLADGTGAFANKDFVGFHILQADSDGLDAVHQILGGARTVVADAAQVVVGDTWYKVGLKYDVSAGTLAYYIDGLIVGTVADVSAVTFPDGEELALLFAMKTPSAAIRYAGLDWWRFAQLE